MRPLIGTDYMKVLLLGWLKYNNKGGIFQVVDGNLLATVF